MTEVVENGQKTFEHFSDMTSKIQMMVINMMPVNDRCRFTRCSKRSQKEVHASKNYIYGLNLVLISRSKIMMSVIYGSMSNQYEYSIQYSYDSALKQKTIIYISNNSVLWETEMDILTSLLRTAVKVFRNQLKTHQNNIKWLYIQGPPLDRKITLVRNICAAVESFNMLENLVVRGDVDITKIVPKIQKPLILLYLKEVKNEQRLVEFPQVYQVKDNCSLSYAKLNNEQFSKLTARDISIPIGRITEREIFKFLRSWQDDTMGKEVGTYTWDLSKSNFDKRKLFKRMRVDEDEVAPIEIKHFKTAGKSAELLQHGNMLEFNTVVDDDFLRPV